MKLVISPQAGFGNRIRALCAGVALGMWTGREVFHYWVPDDRLSGHDNVNDMKTFDPARFVDLRVTRFTGEAVDVCFSEWLPGEHWFAEQSTAQAQLRCGRVERENLDAILAAREEVVLVETSHELHPPAALPLRAGIMADIYRRFFPLAARWRHLADTVPVFDHGFSIRRGAFMDYFPEARVSLEEVAGAINATAGSKLVFSDDEQFAAGLRRLTGAPFTIDPAAYTGTDRALAQFVALGRCHAIHGTRQSSFPEQAALFAGRLFHPL